MYDRFNRHITYLRISVTDRCNLRCRYCMPEEGVQLLSHHDILSFEEIVEVVKTGVSMGIEKVRLTGGEPLARRGIVELVRQLAAVPGIKDLSMTTNGIFLPKYAQQLAEAGLNRVNISLDTVDPDKYRSITRVGGLPKVFKGIEAAREAGLTPIKINCVVFKSRNEQDAMEVERFANLHNLQVRFIHQMDLKTGEFSVVEGGEGGNCSVCNRLRLTANGMLKPCLFSELEYNIRGLGIKKAYELALENKPRCGSYNMSNKFYNIGG